ncbi:MAG: DUF3299 domain-containing protein [Thiomicrorhabdus sp.]|nr:DUF3299 domain-containing protein [Thiomicrorhabdus sp.]
MTQHSKSPLLQWIQTALLSLTLAAFSIQAQNTVTVQQDGSQKHPFELNWSDLIPEGFEPEKLLEKYEKDLAKLESLPDGSLEGLEIIQRIQAEIDHIPTNSKWDNKWVKLPGYIAPLETQNAAVTRFLLVPYFGACIHVPPPPVNQTVLVDLTPKTPIKLNQVDYPFMVTGKLTLDKTQTDIGNAGYHITNATAEIYKDTRWLEEE